MPADRRLFDTGIVLLSFHYDRQQTRTSDREQQHEHSDKPIKEHVRPLHVGAIGSATRFATQLVRTTQDETGRQLALDREFPVFSGLNVTG